jgi:hypothetical protein
MVVSGTGQDTEGGQFETKVAENKRLRERFDDHTGSIASSSKFDTALYKERPPSDGIYAATASATSLSMVSGDIDRACSPPCRNRACEATAIFSSSVKGTKGRTVVTREINEAYIGTQPQST